MRSRGLLVSFVVAGCGVGNGTGAVTGSVFEMRCTLQSNLGGAGAPVPFDLHASFFVADPVNDKTVVQVNPINHLDIRVQSTGARFEEADVVLVNVANDLPVAASLGQPMPLGPSTNVRATLALNQTCPTAAVQAELDGTITFTAFGGAAAGVMPSEDFSIQFGDQLAATFSANIVDRRALGIGGLGGVPGTPSAGGHLDGNFAFEVRQGKAAQQF